MGSLLQLQGTPGPCMEDCKKPLIVTQNIYAMLIDNIRNVQTVLCGLCKQIEKHFVIKKYEDTVR